ncbi:hypothetical protein EV361DRAFT_943478, partial [Lentinula raphanica]
GHVQRSPANDVLSKHIAQDTVDMAPGPDMDMEKSEDEEGTGFTTPPQETSLGVGDKSPVRKRTKTGHPGGSQFVQRVHFVQEGSLGTPQPQRLPQAVRPSQSGSIVRGTNKRPRESPVKSNNNQGQPASSTLNRTDNPSSGSYMRKDIASTATQSASSAQNRNPFRSFTSNEDEGEYFRTMHQHSGRVRQNLGLTTGASIKGKERANRPNPFAPQNPRKTVVLESVHRGVASSSATVRSTSECTCRG